MGKKGAVKKKNKGPKGKKARAKAKLQRQWGEIPQEEPGGRIPRGSKTTKFLSTNKTHSDPEPAQSKRPLFHSGGGTTEDSVREYSVDGDPPRDLKEDMEDDESMEDDENEENAVESFLEKLTSAAIQRQANQEEEDNESEDAADSSNEVNRDEDDASLSSLAVTPVDHFSERFSQSPLPENADILDQKLATIQETCTLPKEIVQQLLQRHNVEFKVSKSWLQKRSLEPQGSRVSNVATKSNTHRLVQQWRAQAKADFSCNRLFLQNEWKRTVRNPVSKTTLFDSSFQEVAYPLLASYSDMLFSAQENFETKRKRKPSSQKEEPFIARAILLHVLNHIWTRQSRIHKHNKLLHDQESNEADQDGGKSSSTDLVRDQGFTRPSVLVLLPTRGVCFEFVRGMQTLLGGDGANIAHWDRFQEEYGPPPVEQDDNGGEKEEQRQERRQEVLEQKGQEWLSLFGDDVNHDDDFRLGMSINVQAPRTKKKQDQGNDEETNSSAASLKLFTDFYRSDVVLASPLGLKMACHSKKGTEEDADEDEASSMDTDFLSSIEICVLMRSNVLLMQNWDHVNDMLKLLNRQPTQAKHTDFSRVRNYFLSSGQSQYWRQLIVDAQDFYDPVIASTFKRFARSIAGMALFRKRTTASKAILCRIVANVRQVFQRIPCSSLLNQGTEKLGYFEKHILPELRQRKHSLVYIPSYFDFVAVRNLLLKREVEFVSVTEYARTSEVSRGRARFLQGRKAIMLYTGRAHFFYRHTIRGARHVIFYGVPEHASFYSDHVNGMSHSSNDNAIRDDDTKSSLALFTKYDAHALERIVGQENCKRMVSGEKLTFLFDF